MNTRVEGGYSQEPPVYDFLSPPPPPLPRSGLPKQPPLSKKPLPPLPPIPSSPISNLPSQNLTWNVNALPMSTPIQSQSVSSTWSLGTIQNHFLSDSTCKASALLDSHDRFKPERSQRRPVQKMKWTQSRLARSLAGDLFSCSPLMTSTSTGQGNHDLANLLCNDGFPNNFLKDHLPLESESRVSSMTIADVSPRLAVKKVLLLYEHAQYREAATFIQRLSVGTFRIILKELPMDILIDAMPHSLPIIEALYSKVFISDGPNVNLKLLKPDTIVLHMVKFFSREEMLRECRKGKDLLGPFTSGCKRILGVIVTAEPKVMKSLQQRRRALDKAVEGMGQHGLVGTTDESLLPLHDALKLEFRRVVDAYKGGLQKLEDLSFSNKNYPKHVSHGPAPIQASHQRQLSLRADEIQERLINNKSLLNLIEPTLDNHCLNILLGILQRRIECDKDALFQFTQHRKEAGDITSDNVVAPLLMRYSRGCKEVLEMMKEVAEEVGGSLAIYEDDSSDLSGYHSDSDSAIMTSGNSPFVSPRARYNFLSRSVRCKPIFRPSIISSSLSSSSGVSSAESRSGSSGSSLPDAIIGRDFISPPSALSTPNSTNPVRLRHVKLKNQLQKNNSLVSSSSSGESESSGSLRSDDFGSIGGSLGCVDYVTVVTVPEDKVVSQGTNHRFGNDEHIERLATKEGHVTELKNEINQLRQALQNSKIKISQLQERETFQDTELQITGKRQKEETRNHWVRQYGALYATARVLTMDALDAIPELALADELKLKLLFSVIVLSFRSVESSVADVMKRIEVILQMDAVGEKNAGCGGVAKASSPLNSSSNLPLSTFPFNDDTEACHLKVREVIGEYLGKHARKFDLSKAIEKVANQLWTTLYDYPCLKRCDGLIKYIRACVNSAWGLCNLIPPCKLEYETRVFQRDLHVRFHSSDQSSDVIKTYLWPALVEGSNGYCVHKGIVIT